MPRVLHIASEVAPFSKTGGLGDVVAALPPAQRAAGVDAHLVTPRYGFVDRAALSPAGPVLPVALGGDVFPVQRFTTGDGGITFLDAPGLLDRPAPYGGPDGDYADNPLRFAVFCRAAAQLALDTSADLCHLHDWQAALTATFLAGRIPVVQTIHNLAYQGRCEFDWADRLDVPEALRHYDGLEFYGGLNLLKAGLVAAARITTVSPRYAEEIQREPEGHGLAGLLRHRSAVVRGILNGLDAREWDPANDPALPAAYSAGDLRGKAACTRVLRAELGLPSLPGPLVGVVARASAQKGLDLLDAILEPLADRDMQFAVLTAGDRGLVEHLCDVARRHPDRFSVQVGFDEGRARRIYAGSDFVLVPSRFEPCGLTQMIGMRYGAVPVVRYTGGLADTVADGATGITFDEATPDALQAGLDRAGALFDDAVAYRAIQARGMAADWDWHRPAEKYAALYDEILRAAPGAPP